MSLNHIQAVRAINGQKNDVKAPLRTFARRRRQAARSSVLDALDETLTNSSKVAASLSDEFLVYLLDMAILHVRKAAANLEEL